MEIKFPQSGIFPSSGMHKGAMITNLREQFIIPVLFGVLNWNFSPGDKITKITFFG